MRCISSVSSYNIEGAFGGVGRPILLHVIHEMDDVHDIRELIFSSRSMRDVVLDKLFPWSVAQGLSQTYSLRSIPIKCVDIVCFLNSSILTVFRFHLG